MDRNVIAIIMVFVFIVGVLFYAFESSKPDGQTIETASGFSYKEVCIEGQLFYATIGYAGSWNLAGPVKEC